MSKNFLVYHPYLSLSTDQIGFIASDGNATVSSQTNTDESDDALELWQLARDAFAALPDFQDRAEFDEYYAEHIQGIAELANLLQTEGKKFVYTTPSGKTINPNFSEFSSASILNVYWQLPTLKNENLEWLAPHFLFACLTEVDSALIGLSLGSDSIFAAISATRCLANYQAIVSGNLALQRARSELAMRAAKERYVNDVKQTERRFVHDCWKAWQLNPSNYSGKAAFARDMIEKCEHLISTKVIEGWCRKWEQAAE